MIEFCFQKLESYLKQIKNSQNEYVFQKSRRLIREKPDYDYITARVTENDPYCLITIDDYKETDYGSFYDTYTEYYITAINHTGSGTTKCSISGNHEGNNSFILKISQAGIIGTPPLPEYQLKRNDQEFTPSAQIPADGRIAIGDGTTFAFEIGEEVIAEDAYTWSTIARRVNIIKIKEINLTLRATIWSKTKQELYSETGYLTQLSSLIKERFVTDGIQVVRQSLGPARFLQGPFETENNLVCGALNVSYTFSLYETRYDALATRLILE